MREFLIAVIAAVTVQNILFTRGLGSSRLLLVSKRSGKDTAIFGGFMMLFLLVLTSFSFLIEDIVPKTTLAPLYIMRPIAYLVTATLLYAALCIVCSLFFKDFFEKKEKLITSACFNCAVFGTVLLTISKYYSFGARIGYAAGSCVGFLLAMFIVSEGRRRIELSKVPAAFKGLPAALIYIGLISLAFYGLTGHQLPA